MPSGAWGFKSPLPHQKEVLVRGPFGGPSPCQRRFVDPASNVAVDDSFGSISGFSDVIGVELACGEVAIFGDGPVSSYVLGFGQILCRDASARRYRA